MHIHTATDLTEFINTHTPAEFKEIAYRGHPHDLVEVIRDIDVQTKARFMLFYAKNYQQFANSSVADVLVTGLNLDKQDLMKLLNLLPHDEFNLIFTTESLPAVLQDYVKSSQYYEHWLEIFKHLNPDN